MNSWRIPAAITAIASVADMSQIAADRLRYRLITKTLIVPVLAQLIVTLRPGTNLVLPAVFFFSEIGGRAMYSAISPASSFGITAP